jgi:hypothetical protein
MTTIATPDGGHGGLGAREGSASLPSWQSGHLHSSAWFALLSGRHLLFRPSPSPAAVWHGQECDIAVLRRPLSPLFYQDDQIFIFPAPLSYLGLRLIGADRLPAFAFAHSPSACLEDHHASRRSRAILRPIPVSFKDTTRISAPMVQGLSDPERVGRDAAYHRGMDFDDLLKLDHAAPATASNGC